MPEAMLCDTLLDQEAFAGAGNVIKTETLFAKKLHPEEKAGDLLGCAAKKLVQDLLRETFVFFGNRRHDNGRHSWAKICRKKACPALRHASGKSAHWHIAAAKLPAPEVPGFVIPNFLSPCKGRIPDWYATCRDSSRTVAYSRHCEKACDEAICTANKRTLNLCRLLRYSHTAQTCTEHFGFAHCKLCRSGRASQ